MNMLNTTKSQSVILRYLPFFLVFIPALSLLSYWIGGDLGLLGTALGLPLAAALVTSAAPIRRLLGLEETAQDILAQFAFDEIVKSNLVRAREMGTKSAVFYMQIDDFETLSEHYGAKAMEQIKHQIVARLRGSLRPNDLLGEYTQSGFAICLYSQPHLDLELCLEISGRLSRTLAEPYSIDATSVYLTASIGFCQLGRESAKSQDTNIDPVASCALNALKTATAAGPSSIRAYTHNKRRKGRFKSVTTTDAVSALENGEIVPWFQPQISTDTGKITGFEALARWIHPTRGPLGPIEFLDQLQSADKMGRLAEAMIYNALTAMKAWDQAGADVPQIGVNFSSSELSDPGLVNKISWELDRFELSPDRLAVEVLETVVAQGPDDVITHNVKGLNEIGCRIDLDDFGTGHASLAAIRRFGVSRIKIDRSYVMKADRDLEQQKMVRAILMMAEKLSLETLAEGVETVGEHSLLAQLGCTHVQGFGIGRPMPFDQTLTWIRQHNEKLMPPPGIGNIAG